MRTLLILLVLAACKKESVSREELEAKLAKAKPAEEIDVADGVKMAMFRTQATSPIAGGWHLATSTKGGFSVEVPIPFNDFRTRANAEDGVEIMTDAIGAKTAGKLSWGAMCVRRPDGKLMKPITEKTEALGDPVRAWQRTVLVPGGVCILIVEQQGDEPLPAQTDIQRFLQSFKLVP